MNKLRIIFQLFLLFVFLAGIYVIIRTDTLFKEQLLNRQHEEDLENFTSGHEVENTGCPNLLLQRGNNIFLYNTNMPLVDGLNPKKFENLDGYIEHLEKQRATGVICPVLFLQKESDVQGNDVYRMRANPYDIRGEITKPKDESNNSNAGYTTTIGVPISVGYFNSGLSPYQPKPEEKSPESSNQNQNVIIQMDASKENAPYNQGTYSGFDPTDLYVGVYTNIDKIHDSTATNSLSDNPMDPNWGGVLYTESQVKSGKYDENNIYKPLLYNPKISYDVGAQHPFPPPKDIIE